MNMKGDISMVFLRKRFGCIFAITVILGCFDGCGEDKSPTTNGENLPFKVTFGGESTEVNLADYPKQTIEGEEVVSLADLVDTTKVAHPFNYGYRIIGEDGFYAHMKGNDDNTWEHIQSGYIILSSMKGNFDPSLGLINRYNIKNAAETYNQLYTYFQYKDNWKIVDCATISKKDFSLISKNPKYLHQEIYNHVRKILD